MLTQRRKKKSFSYQSCRVVLSYFFKHTAPSFPIIPPSVITRFCQHLDLLARSIFNQRPIITFISRPTLHSMLSYAHVHTQRRTCTYRGTVCREGTFHQHSAGRSCLLHLDFDHFLYWKTETWLDFWHLVKVTVTTVKYLPPKFGSGEIYQCTMELFQP